MSFYKCALVVTLFVKLLAFTATNTIAEEHPDTKEQPNLLVIITDEHNFRTLGCYREQLPPEQALMWGPEAIVETPHLDSLAKNGAMFTSMYATAPVCMPSRASMFTGMYPHRVGIPNNSTQPGDGRYLRKDVTTIADVLLKAGYMTGYAGKWHLAENTNKEEFWSPYPVGHPEHDYGFKDKRFMFNGGHDKFKGIDDEGNPYRAHKRPKRNGVDKYGQPVFKDSRSKNVKSTTDWLADRTIEFIDEHKDKPFFYVVSIPDPHTPNAVRAPYNTMFTDLKFEYPRTYDQPRDENSPKWRQPDGKTKHLMRDMPQYFGMVKSIDDNVGRIIAKLEEDGVLENTIIVFASDHGDLCGEHTRVNKGSPFEASGVIPFVIAHGRTGTNPRVPRGKVVNQAANTADWMATFLSLLEISDAPQTAGRDLTPLLGDEVPADWNDITFMRMGYWMMAMSDRYKLYVNASDEKPWLFDLQEDPDEYINFLDNPEYADRAKKLALELRDYMTEHNDKNDKIAAKLLDIIYDSPK